MFAKFVIYFIVFALSAWLLPGVRVEGPLPMLFAAVLLALVNTFLRPILTFFSLPLVILTAGLFLLVINAGTILLAGVLVEGFAIDGFLTAIWMSLILFCVWLLLG